MTHTLGIYPGTFDPPTEGHMDIISRSLNFCDRLIIAIGKNPTKKPLFSEEERIEMIKSAVLDSLGTVVSQFVEVESFDGLLINFCEKRKANLLIRGIRSVSDFEYEINLANVNKSLVPNIDTVFLPTRPELTIVSSSMVKEIAKNGGDVSKFVPSNVNSKVIEKFKV